MSPLHANTRKRLVKSPKIYVRDSGLVHALLRLETLNDIAGQPVAGMSWEGFVIENLLGVAPPRTLASFYRTSAGAEIDLVLELPGKERWAVEIKRALSARPEKGFCIAREDIRATRGFVVHAGKDTYPVSADVEAVSLRALAEKLAGWEKP
jgi:predicted AAA+ superfamily ATPase